MHPTSILGPSFAEGHVEIESRGDAIRLLLVGDSAPSTGEHQLPGVLDIGEAGTLLGVEVDLTGASSLRLPSAGVTPPEHDREDASCYVELAKAPQDGQVRSVPVTVRVLTAGQGTIVVLEVPRRGHGYEISYPSGNR